MKCLLILVFLLSFLTGCSTAPTDPYMLGDLNLSVSENQILVSPPSSYLCEVDRGTDLVRVVYGGRPAGILVASGYEGSITVNLSYVEPEYEYQGYTPAPSYVEDWVISVSKLDIKPGEIWCIPVSLKIEDEESLPDKFWFGIRLEPDLSTIKRGRGLPVVSSVVTWWMVSTKQDD